MSSSAIRSTAMISFSAMQTMLLSSEAPFDDAFGGLVEIRGFVDDDRRIARAGADGFLARGHRGFHDGGAAGDDEQAHARDVSSAPCAVSIVGLATVVIVPCGPPFATITWLMISIVR